MYFTGAVAYAALYDSRPLFAAGSVHAADAEMALQAARDVYTRRGEGLSLWVVPSAAIVASDPGDKDVLFEPTGSKIYRHPTFYEIPEDVGNM